MKFHQYDYSGIEAPSSNIVRPKTAVPAHIQPYKKGGVKNHNASPNRNPITFESTVSPSRCSSPYRKEVQHSKFDRPAGSPMKHDKRDHIGISKQGSFQKNKMELTAAHKNYYPRKEVFTASRTPQPATGRATWR